MKNFLILALISACIFGCASQRTRATCAETEYRLNTMTYSPDQRAFLEEELRQCRELQAEQEKDDVLTNKLKGSIYERFNADSAKADSVKADSLKGDSSLVEGDSAKAAVDSTGASLEPQGSLPDEEVGKSGPSARRKTQRRNSNNVMDEIALKEAGGSETSTAVASDGEAETADSGSATEQEPAAEPAGEQGEEP